MAESYPPTTPTPPPPYALSNTPPYILRLSPQAVSSPPAPLNATELHHRLLYTRQQILWIGTEIAEQRLVDRAYSLSRLETRLCAVNPVYGSWEVALLNEMGATATRGERGFLSTFVRALKGYFGFKKIDSSRECLRNYFHRPQVDFTFFPGTGLFYM